MLKNPGVTYVSEHLLPMCPVYTKNRIGEGKVEEGEGAAQAEHKSARAARGNTANVPAEIDLMVSSVFRVENVQVPGMDIHPVEATGTRLPGRPFAQVRACIQEEFGS